MSSIARPVARSVSRSVLAGQGVDLGYLIRSMFSSGEQGFAYDPNDLSTMFRDAAGTVPVTGVGQPVGLIRDKSGRNNHAYQTNAASRPLLQRNATTGAYYLAFDGSDDFLVTNSINFTGTDKVSLFAGVRKLSDAATGEVVGLSGDTLTTNGAFALLAPAGNGVNKFQFASKGSAVTRFANIADVALSAAISAVVKGVASISTDVCEIIANKKYAGSSALDQGTGNYGNYPLYIGRRGGTSLPFNGHLYSLIGIGRLTTDSETLAIEKELAKRLGVTLNV